MRKRNLPINNQQRKQQGISWKKKSAFALKIDLNCALLRRRWIDFHTFFIMYELFSFSRVRSGARNILKCKRSFCTCWKMQQMHLSQPDSHICLRHHVARILSSYVSDWWSISKLFHRFFRCTLPVARYNVERTTQNVNNKMHEIPNLWIWSRLRLRNSNCSVFNAMKWIPFKLWFHNCFGNGHCSFKLFPQRDPMTDARCKKISIQNDSFFQMVNVEWFTLFAHFCDLMHHFR